MTLFNVRESDVTVNIFNTTNPAVRLDKGSSLIFGSVGPMSVAADGSSIMLAHIQLLAEITVGKLAPEVLARTDWSFGFIQAVSLGAFFAVWSGAKSNTGSVSLRLLDDTGRTFPDADRESPEGRAASPFTKPRATRFKFDAAQGIINCDTGDGPGFRIPATIRNLKTSADNFLEFVKDSRQICCALVVEEQAETPKIRFIGHSIWDLHLVFKLKWVKGNIVSQSSSTVNVGKFKFGPPDDPDLKKMLDPSFLTRTTYNEQATRELNTNIKAQLSDKKDERDTWGLSTPQDFFIP